LPGGRIFADCLLVLRLVYDGMQLGQGILGFLCLSCLQPVAELFERRSQAAPVTPVSGSMLQILSVGFKSRRMIGHSE
jgi:hypothetical protein